MTTEWLDEAGLALLESPKNSVQPTEDDSNLLDSMTPAENKEGGDYSGQREIDSDEMDDEMMDEH